MCVRARITVVSFKVVGAMQKSQNTKKLMLL
jgi:hypothetical protein